MCRLYRPDRIVARDGQQSGVWMNAFGNQSQCPFGSRICDCSHGIAGGFEGSVSND